mmetsp:Transcript_458/g.672  ORF Transcript_458/g.672 Transcript_458/m.672 type:complete len:382 (+) Transcript_458:49-1194(+)|eukprot:CAMPEP_0194211062 /NCGR_PEP_ID=MMETSP0156-20130528/9261_1 /TAXON_ID=33649 /ORGANISM="Thalassionema nitzschioides, Strain L26-B" /LENGTH=381 /DNA_ID=CAMNT_0038938487 /DNA_START=49 /DNA_END=1194 /DNA_ORIENTATION=+
MTFSRERRSIYISCRFAAIYLTALKCCEGFTNGRPSFVVNTRLSIYAPPGSGYATPEDEESELPDSYEPMMEFPGTMRPGRTPENMPFHDLPIGDDQDVPIPWPHFQQIEWHHRWDPPNPHPIPMELFIEMNGRWASAEDEADMRAMTRKNVRDRREMEEQERKSTLIIDDEDEDDEDDNDIPIELGEGVFGALGSGSEQAITTAAVTGESTSTEKTPVEDETQEDDFEDFLIDLGLDSDNTDDLLVEDDIKPPASAGQDDGTSNLLDAMTNMLGEEAEAGDSDDNLDLDLGLLDIPEEGTIDITMDTDNEDIDDASAVAALSDDEDLDIGLDDDLSSDGGMTMVPLEDFGDDSLLDDEDVFDDGGFDYDGGDDSSGGDGW